MVSFQPTNLHHIAQPLITAALCAMPLLWGTWKGWPAHRLLLAQAAVFVMTGIIVATVISRAFPDRAPSLQDMLSGALDTSVALMSYGMWLSLAGLVLAALSILPWLAARLARPL